MTRAESIRLHKMLRDIIAETDCFCYYTKRQKFYKSNHIIGRLWDRFTELIPILDECLTEINGDMPVFDLESFGYTLAEMQGAMELKDYLLLMDLFELQLLPAFMAVEERIAAEVGVFIDEELLEKNVRICYDKNPQLLYSLLPEEMIREIIDVGCLSEMHMDQLGELVESCMAEGYQVEVTSSGYYTLAIQREEHKYYQHTNGNIVAEAMALAGEWLSQEQEEYLFYGMGFGYPYMEMIKMDENVLVQVIETNRQMLFLSLLFGCLGDLYQTERFSVVYDPTGHKIRNMSLGITEQKGFYIFYPALQGIKNPILKQSLRSYFVEESSVRTQYRSLIGNFRRNIKVESGSILDLKEKFQKKKIIIVAAGPSLDKNLFLLKQKREDYIILAVGTVFRKLLKTGIRPDYVMLTDGNATAYRQFEGLIDENVPLIFLSTAYSRAVSEYKGKKYILCQSGFLPAEQMAEKYGWQLVETGGSVATTAFDLCLRLKAARIIFIGLDLAFTKGMDHAGETAEQAKVVGDTGIYVEDIHGNRVMTGENLHTYLRWFERRLKNRTSEEKTISVIDATEGGAKISGMEVMGLKDAIAGRKKSLLIITTAYIYDAVGCFVREIAGSWREKNVFVDIMDARDRKKFDEQKKEILDGRAYDMVFAFNAIPLEEEPELMERLFMSGIQYCSFLLDHPIYHHSRLQKANDQCVIFVPDSYHLEYLKRFYKNIKHVFFLPHGGSTCSKIVPYQDRTISISFFGSYTASQVYLEKLEQKNDIIRVLQEELMLQMKEHTTWTIEQTFDWMIEQYQMEEKEEDISNDLSALREADSFVRSYFREQVLRTILEAGLIIDVYGKGWENFEAVDKSCLRIHPPCGHDEVLELMGNSKIVLNVLPWFKGGAHERIFDALGCGAVALTDSSSYLESLENQDGIVFYNLNCLSELPRQIRDILDRENGEEVSKKGYQNYMEYHTWERRAEEILSCVEQVFSNREDSIYEDTFL